MGVLGETASSVEEERRERTWNGFSRSETSERVRALSVGFCGCVGVIGLGSTWEERSWDFDTGAMRMGLGICLEVRLSSPRVFTGGWTEIWVGGGGGATQEDFMYNASGLSVGLSPFSISWSEKVVESRSMDAF